MFPLDSRFKILLMTFLILAASAVVPSLLLMWYFHARDLYPEPPRVVWTTFGLGIVIIVPVVAVAWPLDQIFQGIEHPIAFGLLSAFFTAAIPEELCKLVVLWAYAARHSAFDEPMDGIVYGVAASLGFATLENVLYVAEGGGSVAILRALTAVPGHAFLGAIMGHFVSRAKFSAEGAGRQRSLVAAFAVPTLLHGLYDFPLLAAVKVDEAEPSQVLPALGLLLIVPAVLVVEGIWSIKLVQRRRREQLAATQAALPPDAVPSVPALGEPAAGHSPQAAAATAKRPSRLLAYLMTLTGAVIACGAGLVILAVALGVMLDATEPDEILPLMLGAILLGIFPFAVGTGLFATGLSRLNRGRSVSM